MFVKSVAKTVTTVLANAYILSGSILLPGNEVDPGRVEQNGIGIMVYHVTRSRLVLHEVADNSRIIVNYINF